MIIGSFYADYLAGRELNAGGYRSVVRTVLAAFRPETAG